MKIYAGRGIKSLAAIIRPEYVIDVMRGLGCAAMVAVAGAVWAHAGICGMRTCGEVDPVSIDVAEPVFGWQMVTDTLRQNQRQTAWRIEVNDADGSVTYQFTIPANTQAQVTLPGMKPFTLGSGRYRYW